MFSPEIVADAVAKNDACKSPSGISCYFIKLNDDWGLKVYREKWERDLAYERQNLMAQHGYAPTTGTTFDIGEKYCYVTQMAEVLIDDTIRKRCYYAYADKAMELTKAGVNQEIRSLRDKMSALGFDPCDDHYGNFARINGQLVCIDFGRC